MVVDDFNIAGIAVIPDKAQTKLIVESDAVLSHTISAQGFEPIARWRAQKIECCGAVELLQLALRDGVDIDEPLHPLSAK